MLYFLYYHNLEELNRDFESEIVTVSILRLIKSLKGNFKICKNFKAHFC